MGSERGIATWDAVGIFVLVVSAEVVGESGDSAGCKTFTLYVGMSGSSGCWMTVRGQRRAVFWEIGEPFSCASNEEMRTNS